MPAGTQVDEAVAIGKQLAGASRIILRLAKEAVNKAYETHLQEGIYLERRLLYATFATHDRQEGMSAFAEKRRPEFLNR